MAFFRTATRFSGIVRMTQIHVSRDYDVKVKHIIEDIQHSVRPKGLISFDLLTSRETEPGQELVYNIMTKWETPGDILIPIPSLEKFLTLPMTNHEYVSVVPDVFLL